MKRFFATIVGLLLMSSLYAADPKFDALLGQQCAGSILDRNYALRFVPGPGGQAQVHYKAMKGRDPAATNNWEEPYQIFPGNNEFVGMITSRHSGQDRVMFRNDGDSIRVSVEAGSGGARQPHEATFPCKPIPGSGAHLRKASGDPTFGQDFSRDPG